MVPLYPRQLLALMLSLRLLSFVSLSPLPSPVWPEADWLSGFKNAAHEAFEQLESHHHEGPQLLSLSEPSSRKPQPYSGPQRQTAISTGFSEIQQPVSDLPSSHVSELHELALPPSTLDPHARSSTSQASSSFGAVEIHITPHLSPAQSQPVHFSDLPSDWLASLHSAPAIRADEQAQGHPIGVYEARHQAMTSPSVSNPANLAVHQSSKPAQVKTLHGLEAAQPEQKAEFVPQSRLKVLAATQPYWPKTVRLPSSYVWRPDASLGGELTLYFESHFPRMLIESYDLSPTLEPWDVKPDIDNIFVLRTKLYGIRLSERPALLKFHTQEFFHVENSKYNQMSVWTIDYNADGTPFLALGGLFGVSRRFKENLREALRTSTYVLTRQRLRNGRSDPASDIMLVLSS